MSWIFWVWVVIALKLPVIGMAIFLHRVINDTPRQVVGEAGDGGGTRFDQGPRRRGPEEGPRAAHSLPRRGDVGHRAAGRTEHARAARRGGD